MDGQGARYAESEGLFVMLRPDALVAPGVTSARLSR
jgi:hypothetical protein